MLKREEIESFLIHSILHKSEDILKIESVFVPELFSVPEHRDICAAMHRQLKYGNVKFSASTLALDPELHPQVTGKLWNIDEDYRGRRLDLFTACRLLTEFKINDAKVALLAKLKDENNCFDILDTVKKFGDESESLIWKNAIPKSKSERLGDFTDFLLLKNRLEGIPSGFDFIDRLMEGGGFQPGSFTLVAGTPGAGKTSFMLNMAWNAATHKIPAVFIEGEMGEKEINLRLNGIDTGYPINDIRKGDRYAEYSKPFVEKYYSTPFDLKIDDERTPDSLFRIMRKAITEGARMIYVDYLQCFRSRKGKSADEYFEIKIISEQLRGFALKHNIALLAASSMNRNEMSSQRPTLGSLYGSSGLGHDASTVFILNGDQKDSELATKLRKVELIIAKNRNGGRGALTFDYQLECQRFIQTFSPATPESNKDDIFS